MSTYNICFHEKEMRKAEALLMSTHNMFSWKNKKNIWIAPLCLELCTKFSFREWPINSGSVGHVIPAFINSFNLQTKPNHVEAGACYEPSHQAVHYLPFCFGFLNDMDMSNVKDRRSNIRNSGGERVNPRKNKRVIILQVCHNDIVLWVLTRSFVVNALMVLQIK